MEETIPDHLLHLLPQYDEIVKLLEADPEANFILKLATTNAPLLQAAEANEDTTALHSPAIEETSLLLQCLSDRYWELIHTGHFSKVPLAVRRIYALANFLRIFYLLHESTECAQLEKCSEILDQALLVGCTQGLHARAEQLQQQLIMYLNSRLSHKLPTLPILQPLPRNSYACDVPQLQCPSVETFRHAHFEPQLPALLLDTIEHWPARIRWLDLNYLQRQAGGSRRVPIEIGQNYASTEWSQQLMRLQDFLQRQFGQQQKDNAATNAKNVEYLAQHELFQQVPTLQQDIRLPDYCVLGQQQQDVDIRAWLGPCGTLSPLHQDPKHNLLCQVFGSKRVILAAPSATPFLYTHDGEMLGNTSRVDAEAPQLNEYPLVEQVQFLQLTLQEGDCLYIPPKWWHQVRSLSPSFSVSFWWT